VILTEGDRDTVEEARRICPEDPDLWLAWLVTRTRQEGRGPWAVEEMQRAVFGQTFSVGAMVSAGDFLLRKGMAGAAAVAARDAIARSQGYVPAFVLGLKCAVAQNDLKWALSCTLRGAETALDPAPFYKTIVEIKSTGKNVDRDLVLALEYLREHAPAEKLWAERLGQVYFWQHDAERALAVLSPLIAEDIRGVRVQSLLLAAEAARLEGQSGKAVGILETAYAMYPEQMKVLNNLVYNLAQNPRTVQRARDLLPSLLAMSGESFTVYDTAATVYLRSGQIESAKRYMDKALKLIDQNGYGVQEVKLNAAEIMIHSGEYDEARRRLEELRRTPGVPNVVDMSARQLLEQIREITGK
jgi:Tfp pilus assembly protein PilF